MSAFGALTLMLTGCMSRGWGGGSMLGDGDGGTAGMTGYGINAAGPGQMGMGYSDQQFIWMMIPHYEGAIAMADLALNRAKRTEIKELAKSIKASQTRENAQMRTWYQQWYGKAVPSWGPGTGWGWQGGMGMGMGTSTGGGMGMGMRGGTNLSALSAAPDFDRAFIEQMIPHHQMGVMMASMAQTNSQHPQLRAMQQAMVKAQSREIEQMSQWYRNWYGTP